ncbi:MAG: T9SS type A sorting domain-containing protein [Bacteroidota bacterium]
MKTIYAIAVSLLCCISTQAAMVQFINNIASENIDIYITESRQFKNIAFRQGSPFFLLPEGRWKLQIAPANSEDVTAAFAEFDIVVEPGNYLFLLSGSLESTQLFTHRKHQFNASADAHIGMTFVHAHPHTSAVHFLSEEKAVLETLDYGQFSEYISVPDSFSFVLTDEANHTLVHHRVALDFWREKSIVFFTSIVEEQATKRWQTYALLYDGHAFPLERLPLLSEYGRSSLQIIQNAPDQVFDLYIESELVADDFNFHAATTFLTLPKYEHLDIGIAPANSRSAEDIFSVITMKMNSDLGHILFLHRTADHDFFMPQIVSDIPDLSSIHSVDVGFAQGATALESVEVWIDGQLLYEDVEQWQSSPYQTLPSRPFRLELRRSGAAYSLATYQVNLHAWRGRSVQLYTFNDTDKSFGLQAVTPDTSFTIFPISTADSGVEERAQSPLLEEWRFYFRDGEIIGIVDVDESSLLAWTVLDAQGRRVYQAAVQQYEKGELSIRLAVPHLPSGIYFVEVSSPKGVAVYPLSIIHE